MVAFLRSWVLNIVTIIIFITFLEILLPSSSIKKYIKMIAGLLVMLVILNPLLAFVNGKVKIENEIIKTSAILDQKSLSLNINQLENQQDKQMIDLYKVKIENSIKDRIEYENNVEVLSIHSIIDDNIKSNTFGSIQQLEVVITDYKEKTEELSSSIIPTIKISIRDSKEKISSTASDESSILLEKIKTNISDIYGLEKKNIQINIE